MGEEKTVLLFVGSCTEAENILSQRYKILPVSAMEAKRTLESGEELPGLCAIMSDIEPGRRRELSYMLDGRSVPFFIISAGAGERGAEVTEEALFEYAENVSKPDRMRVSIRPLADNLPSDIGVLSTMLDSVECGISLCRVKNGKIEYTYINEVLCRLHGYEPEEYVEVIRNCTLEDVVHAEDFPRVSAFCRSLEYDSKGGECTFRTKLPDGNFEWLRMSAKLYRVADGVRHFVLTFVDVDDEVSEREWMRYRAEHDPLTGIYNKEAFFSMTKNMLLAEPDRKYALIRWNINRFKLVNDLLGTDTGNRVLQETASRIMTYFCGIGTYGRLDSDNFAACVPCDDFDIEEITKITAEPYKSIGVLKNIDVSFGVCVIDDTRTPVDQLCDNANLALQTVKGSCIQHYAFYDETMRSSIIEEQTIRDCMVDALNNDQFELYLQPIVDSFTGKVVSAEALVRWRHPQKGFMMPDSFISHFEKSGFVRQMDHYVWTKVCAYLKQRKDAGLPQIPISVNASRLSIFDPEMISFLEATVENFGIDRDLLRIEMTENACVDSPDRLRSTISELRERGFQVYMDDFGSGYSSLNTLKDIPVSSLKVDMKFLSGFENGGRVGTVLTAVVRLAMWLDIPVIAEGVETEEQAEFLRSIGCEFVQGYLYSEPMTMESFEKFAGDRSSESSCRVFNPYTNHDIDMLLGSNPTVSRLIEGTLGGLAIYEMTDDKRIEAIRVNRRYYEIMGYDPHSFSASSLNVIETIHPNYRKSFMDACEEAVSTGCTPNLIVGRFHANGHFMYLDTAVTCLASSENRPIIAITFNDVTDKLRAERDKEVKRFIDGFGLAFDEMYVADIALDKMTQYSSEINKAGSYGSVTPFTKTVDKWINDYVEEKYRDMLREFFSKRNDEEQGVSTVDYSVILDGKTVKVNTALVYIARDNYLVCTRTIPED